MINEDWKLTTSNQYVDSNIKYNNKKWRENIMKNPEIRRVAANEFKL